MVGCSLRCGYALLVQAWRWYGPPMRVGCAQLCWYALPEQAWRQKGPTFAEGLCALMLLCLASAGMAIIGPADAGTTYDGLHRAIGLVPWATNTAFGPST
jgi:hypothetical protein